VVTVSGPDQRRLKPRQVEQLRDLLLACPAAKEPGSRRQTLLPMLEDELGAPLNLAYDQRGDLEVVNLIRACQQFGLERGLQALASVVEVLDGPIDPVADLRAFVEDVVVPGLLPQGMLEKLRSIAPRGVVSDHSARQLAHQAAPGTLLTLGSQASFAAVVDRLADLNVQQGGLFPYPLVTFVELLTRNVQDKTVIAKLRDWTAEAVRILGMEPSQLNSLRRRIGETQHKLAPYLLVCVTPSGPDKERDLTDQGFWIEGWLVDERGDPHLSFHVHGTGTLRDLEHLEQGWLDRLANLLPRSINELTIEYFLPRRLLCYPVDQWALLLDEDKSDDVRSKVGHEYRVVVRWLDRVTKPHARGHWLAKWELFLARELKPTMATVVWADRLGLEDPKELYPRLISQDGEVCLGLTAGCAESPLMHNLLKYALLAGIPVAVWLRQPVGDPQQFLDKVEARLAEKGYASLLDLVRQQRLDAGWRDDHLGSHVALLWDDPNRLPPLLRPFVEPQPVERVEE